MEESKVDGSSRMGQPPGRASSSRGLGVRGAKITKQQVKVFLQVALCHVCAIQRAFWTGPGFCVKRLSAGCVFGTGCL